MTYREHNYIQCAIQWHFQKRLRFFYWTNPSTWAIRANVNQLMENEHATN